MENREELYDKTPFYMTYPMQNLYLAEMEYEKDMERMKELYPNEVQQLLRLIESRCDELEREGSRMYDENPDRFMMDQEVCRLYEEFLRENPQYDNMRPMPEQGMQRPRRYSLLPPDEFRDMMTEQPSWSGMQIQEYGEELAMQNRRRCDNPWLCGLIGVLFNDEVYRRRCRNRRCRRWQI